MSLDPGAISALSTAAQTAPIALAAASVFKNAQPFLERICGPLADEIGIDLAQGYRNLRGLNTAQTLVLASQNEHYKAGTTIHPRIVLSLLEKASLYNEPDIQKVWAGLLCSSCTESGLDDSNTIYISLLSQLSSSEVRLLNYLCGETQKYTDTHGWNFSELVDYNLLDLEAITMISDMNRIRSELMHLVSLGLINRTLSDIGAEPLALALYIRCQGSMLPPEEYWTYVPMPKSAKTPGRAVLW